MGKAWLKKGRKINELFTRLKIGGVICISSRKFIQDIKFGLKKTYEDPFRLALDLVVSRTVSTRLSPRDLLKSFEGWPELPRSPLRGDRSRDRSLIEAFFLYSCLSRSSRSLKKLLTLWWRCLVFTVLEHIVVFQLRFRAFHVLIFHVQSPAEYFFVLFLPAFEFLHSTFEVYPK